MFRCEAVADRDHGQVRMGGVVLELKILIGFGLEDPAAAVDVVEDAL